MGIYRIESNNNDITEHVKNRLISLSISDAAGIKSDTLSLSIDNSDGKLALPRTGTELKVWLKGTYKGLYTIDELELPIERDLIHIHARAAKMTGSIKAPQDRVWHQTSVGDILTKIAGEHDLESSCSQDLASVQIAHLDQVKESDLAFLARLAKAQDAIFKPVAGRLLFLQKGENKNVRGQSLPKVTISDSEKSHGTLRVTESASYFSVEASYIDAASEQTKTLTVGDKKPLYKLRKPFKSEADARKAAKAELRKLMRGKASLALTRPLSPEILPEMAVDIKNHKEGVDGQWIVEKVDHKLDSSGSSTQISLQIKE